MRFYDFVYVLFFVSYFNLNVLTFLFLFLHYRLFPILCFGTLLILFSFQFSKDIVSAFIYVHSIFKFLFLLKFSDNVSMYLLKIIILRSLVLFLVSFWLHLSYVYCGHLFVLNTRTWSCQSFRDHHFYIRFPFLSSTK